ncbi:MAG: hypothetical protein ACC612_09630 [Methanomethylovorans sp.]|uniref:hypothetical protein n=1 Tax=Methanomethylovorans sp. TaxID=2758717 RepID=UPI0035309BC1
MIIHTYYVSIFINAEDTNRRLINKELVQAKFLFTPVTFCYIVYDRIKERFSAL